MGALGLHLPAALSLLALPTNLVALLGGVLTGLMAARLVLCAGLDRVVVLALLFPIAALLDPATALILLVSAWVSALVISAPPERIWRVVGIAVLAAAVIAGAVGPAALLVPKLASVEKVALLAMAAALVVFMAAQTSARAWGAALALIILGLALELSPLHPLDSANASPRALLLGLLAVGPALVSALWPARALEPAQSNATLKTATTLLPLLLLAMPVTATAALLTLALGEHGLSAGQALLSQRPRIVLSLVLALAAAAGLAALAGAASRAISWQWPMSARRPHWLPSLDASTATRLCAAVVLLVTAALLVRLGVERLELTMLAVAALVGGALLWFGQSAAPLLIGLTIGEAMQAALAPAVNAGFADVRALILGALALFAILAALAWPWPARAIRAKLG